MTSTTSGGRSGWNWLISGARRRLRWLRWRLLGDRPTPAEAAFAWLFGPETADWVPAKRGDRRGCPVTTGAAIAVANEFGMLDRAQRWQAWLKSLSAADLDPGALGVMASDTTARQAAQAVACYEAGSRAEGDRRMRRLAAVPLRSGLATVCYLKAALLQVHVSFEQSPDDLPDQIDPEDGRVQAVLQWVGSLGPKVTLADVGCGKGRFLRHVAAAFPRVALVGIDPSEALLRCLPTGVESRRGSLLSIPAADGEFDAALAVESLEHALAPARAVDELCRVVRPGGQVLIIDKHRARQARSEHAPWERWFWPDELADWLEPHCDEVRVESIAHLEGRPGRVLFLAACGRRKAK